MRGYRHELGWSQEEFGGRSGLHASYIGQIGRLMAKPSTWENNPTTCLQIGDLPSANYPTTCGRWWDKQVVG